MRDSPKDTPTTTAPEPRRDGYAVVVRGTWACRFDDPAVPAALEKVGQMLADSHQEGGTWGTTHDRGVVRCGALAVAADLKSVGEFLALEVAGAPTDYELTPEELDLCHQAATWRVRLLTLAREIRRAADSESTTAAEPEEGVRDLTEEEVWRRADRCSWIQQALRDARGVEKALQAIPRDGPDPEHHRHVQLRSSDLCSELEELIREEGCPAREDTP